MSNPVLPDPASPGRVGTRAKRPLETLVDILPALQEAEATSRPLWRHPAFLVATGLALVAVIVTVVLLVLGVFGSDPVASDLKIARTPDAVHVTWSGPDVAYDVYVLGGPKGELLDVSQLATGREAWLPLHAGLVDDDACVLVRPAVRNAQTEVGTTVPELEAQGGARACIPDAAG